MRPSTDYPSSPPPALIVALMVAGLAVGPLASRAEGQQRRARPPVFRDGQFEGVFESDLSRVVREDRPRVDQLRAEASAGTDAGGAATGSGAMATASGVAASAPSAGASTGASGGTWRPLAEPVHLEDEVKRLKLRYDSGLTTPGRFKSGDYAEAQRDLAMLATLMAVIAQYEGEVRFQKDAPVARDLLARSARNVSSGSTEAFNEAMQRKADLQDLISGGGLQRPAPSEPSEDWSLVANRSSLMKYLDQVTDQTLREGTTDEASIEANLEDLKRAASMVAIMAEVLKQDGMDDAEDDEYRRFADDMRDAALEVKAALEQEQAEAARRGVAAIGQSCDACHNSYR